MLPNHSAGDAAASAEGLRDRAKALNQDSKGLTVPEWEPISIESINLSDRTFQYRLESGIADVRASLKREGQREPIDLAGRPLYRIIDGFRRTEAAKALGWPTIRAFVHRSISDQEAFQIAFTKNVIRKNLSPLDRAQAMILATQRGVERGHLAEVFGISDKQVSRYLQLATFPSEVQEVLDGRIITMAHARVLAQAHVADPAEWARRIEVEGIDARTLKRLLGKERGARKLGRPIRCLRIARNGIRFYPVLISRGEPEAERLRIIGILEEAIQALRSW